MSDPLDRLDDGPPFLISAVFQPLHLETLRPGCLPYVGQRLTFSRCWVVRDEDGGPYVGQWTWLPTDAAMGWVPQEDLTEIECATVERMEGA